MDIQDLGIVVHVDLSPECLSEVVILQTIKDKMLFTTDANKLLIFIEFQVNCMLEPTVLFLDILIHSRVLLLKCGEQIGGAGRFEDHEVLCMLQEYGKPFPVFGEGVLGRANAAQLNLPERLEAGAATGLLQFQNETASCFIVHAFV